MHYKVQLMRNFYEFLAFKKAHKVTENSTFYDFMTHHHWKLLTAVGSTECAKI